ncbi:MAG: BlaI/MecI/CopY family transcriptional regulator [Xanthomonadales bacterium]|jgi:predicted transcriptional regulator|nr:BlaI/MecI/CopY family transcriptional regulator [Xanthomonadales bacterium]
MKRRKQSLTSWLGAVPSRRVPDLGEREMNVLEVLWSLGELSAQDVREALSGQSVSLSTVQSTLERLHRKALLEREKIGRAYRYRPLLTRTQLIGGLLRDLAEDVAGGDVAPMLSGFLDYVAAEAPELGPGVSRALALVEEPREGQTGKDDDGAGND